MYFAFSLKTNLKRNVNMRCAFDKKTGFWKGDENAWKTESTRIATEQLTNGIENRG